MIRLCLACSVAAALTGCLGGPGDVAGPGVNELARVSPLPRTAEAWTTVPADCAGRIRPDLTFAVVETLPELLLASDDRGAVCVGAFEDIEDELSAQSVGEAALDSLHARYLRTLWDIEVTSFSADPSPQPNTGRVVDTDIFKGDPSPQPNNPRRPSPTLDSSSTASTSSSADTGQAASGPGDGSGDPSPQPNSRAAAPAMPYPSGDPI